jgi:hypothetical protein
MVLKSCVGKEISHLQAGAKNLVLINVCERTIYEGNYSYLLDFFLGFYFF